VLLDHVSAAILPPAAPVANPVLPSSTQFDITGFLQDAKLDPTCIATAGGSLDPNGFPQAAHCGGTMQLNGHTIVVPAETIVILPASALSWQELFAQAPAPYGPSQTGMAISDNPKPLTTYEFQAVGNRVIDPANPDPAKRDRYIAGMVHASQQDLNGGAGYINFMNYATGEMRVGGVLGDPTTGARVRLNDPASPTSAGGGRYGRAMSPDGRFMVDQDNPTIASASGFPMCFPRTDPLVGDDSLCPRSNRPVDPTTGTFSSLFQMNSPANLPLGGALDPRVQAPMEVGDYINFAGTLIADANGTYISAHTITNNTAIYTAPGTNPAYVSIEVGLIGTGGLTVFGAGEAAIRTRFEGMTTDSTRGVHLYGVDVNPDGSTSDRDWGTIMPDPGTPVGAVRGRWRFRPPCLTFGSVPAKPDKDCVYGPGNGFLPPTREVRAVVEGLQTQNPANPQAATSANGIVYGQYHAPIGEYIFPENTPGNPIPENNFNTIPFLAQGGYTSFSGLVAGQLDPWPSNIVPPPVCVAPPQANAGGPYLVASGGTVALAGSSTGRTPTFSWAAPASGSLSSLTTAAPVFTAPLVGATTVINLSLTATNTCGTTTATTTVTVGAAGAPSVNPVGAQTVASGSAGTFAVTGTDPNVPAATPLTFTVVQTGGTPVLTGLTVTQNGPTGANIGFTAPSGVAANTDVTVSVTAKNSVGVSSLASASVTITITPVVVGAAPVANAGGPYTVASGGTVTLAGSATGTAPLNFNWAIPAPGSIANRTIANAVYTAPTVGADTTVNLSLTVSNSFGSSTATTTVLVKAALGPTVAPISPVSLFSGANGTFTVSGVDPAGLVPLTFTATQAPTALTGLTVLPLTGTTARVNFTAPLLPPGQTTPTVVQVTVTAKNSLNVASAPVTTTVTVNPVPDSVAITAAEFRTGKQRLILTATSSIVSPNVTLRLLPYLTTTGATFDPAGLGDTFTNGGGGLYTMTLVGAPQPAAGPVLFVRSNLGSTSPGHALDRVRA
jgi:hypothetical protein